jgi:hypothetical protein
LLFGASEERESFDNHLSQDVQNLDSTLAERKKEWEQEAGGMTGNYPVAQSIHDELVSSIREANMHAQASSTFWQGKVLKSMGMSRRAQFERAYRENVINPEIAVARNRAVIGEGAAAGAVAGSISAGGTSQGDGMSR